MTIHASLLIPYKDKIKDWSKNLFELAQEIAHLSISLNDLVNQIDNHAKSVNEEMKQFHEGFAYERPKTAGKRGKKPVLHSLES